MFSISFFWRVFKTWLKESLLKNHHRNDLEPAGREKKSTGSSAFFARVSNNLQQLLAGVQATTASATPDRLSGKTRPLLCISSPELPSRKTSPSPLKSHFPCISLSSKTLLPLPRPWYTCPLYLSNCISCVSFPVFASLVPTPSGI